jgi:hypothetical protein
MLEIVATVRPVPRWEASMDDAVFLLLTLAFFAACIGLVGLFERMRPRP